LSATPNPYQAPDSQTILPTQGDGFHLLVWKLILAFVIGSVVGALCYWGSANFAQFNITSKNQFDVRLGTGIALTFCPVVALWVAFWQGRMRPIYSGFGIAVLVAGIFLSVGGKNLIIDMIILPSLCSGLIFVYWKQKLAKKSGRFYGTVGALSGALFCLCFFMLGVWLEIYWFGFRFKLTLDEQIWRETCSRSVTFALASGFYWVAVSYFLCYQWKPESSTINGAEKLNNSQDWQINVH